MKIELTEKETIIILHALEDNDVTSYLNGAKTTEGSSKYHLINKIQAKLDSNK